MGGVFVTSMETHPGAESATSHETLMKGRWMRALGTAKGLLRAAKTVMQVASSLDWC